MVRKTVRVGAPSGLHARPAALFVTAAGNYKALLRVAFEGKEVDAKSILGVLSLGVAQNASVVLSAEGEDAEEAIVALSAILEKHDDAC